jgi:hypothetical protein
MFVNDIFYNDNNKDNKDNINNINNNSNNNYFNRVYLCICQQNKDELSKFNLAYKYFNNLEEANLYKQAYLNSNSNVPILTKIVPICKYTPNMADKYIIDYKFKDYIRNKIVL